MFDHLSTHSLVPFQLAVLVTEQIRYRYFAQVPIGADHGRLASTL